MTAAPIVLLLAAQPIWMQDEGPFARGMVAANAREFAKALRLRRALTPAGDPRAAYYEGMAFGHGEGVVPDAAEAGRYYRIAADPGPAEASNALAVLLIKGRGMGADAIEELAWIALAAERSSGFAADNRDQLDNRLSDEQRRQGEARLAALRASGP